jgi:nucleotide-binding universal stress UspA family protein
VFSNVLVGIDGRDGGQDAIALARQLANPDGRITLAHVYSTGRTVGRGTVLALPFEREDSQRLLEAEKAAAGIDATLVPWNNVPPARGLHELADRLGADLLVVGASRHSVLGHALMGDDAQAALSRAPCAIAIAPRGHTQSERPFAQIGVAYNGSPESEHALSIARDIAGRRCASIKALWVVSLEDVRAKQPIPDEWPDAAEQTHGDPREELASFSKEVDLLVTGSRGFGPIGRLFHGSISSYLARNVACPLLVLPRSATSDARLDVPAQSNSPIGARD